MRPRQHSQHQTCVLIETYQTPFHSHDRNVQEYTTHKNNNQHVHKFHTCANPTLTRLFRCK